MSFDNMQDCGGIQEKSGEVIIMIFYAVTNDEIVEFAMDITLDKKLLLITGTFHLFQYGLFFPDIQGTTMLAPYPQATPRPPLGSMILDTRRRNIFQRCSNRINVGQNQIWHERKRAWTFERL
jgi:hypothetical protein